ncbi:ankycorbin isoform X2 [Latimeria chalumnae]|uniref:ankycorbin isoform X2 n=1 Tax=Latimeria chalumnae TaxID=7897 RepID=UPI00313AC492
MKSLKAKFRKSDTHEWNKNDDRLLQAVEHGDAEKVASLLGKKGIVVTKQDSEGRSAFHLAATKGHAECLGVMLSHGVDVTAPDNAGRSVLHLAAKDSHYECVKRLLQSKCPVDGVDNSRKTPLFYAAASGCINIVQMLCEHKCPVNFKDTEGFTPLIVATQHNHAEVCKYLIDHGADINSRDKNGRTALMLGCETGSFNAVDVLIRMGADPKLVDALGHDALYYSNVSGNAEILNHLQTTLQKRSQEADAKTLIKPKQNFQQSDISSPQSTASTPSTWKEHSSSEQYLFKGDETKSNEETRKLLEERTVLLETITNLRQLLDKNKEQEELKSSMERGDGCGQDKLTDTGTENLVNARTPNYEPQDVVQLLQEKITALTLKNKQLQDKLQTKTRRRGKTASGGNLWEVKVKSPPIPPGYSTMTDKEAHRGIELDNSFDSNGSYHSTQTDFDQSSELNIEKCAEIKVQELKSPLVSSHVSSKMESCETINNIEEKIQQLQETLQDVQMKLHHSELEKKQLEAQLQSRSLEDVQKGEDFPENGFDLSQKLKVTQDRYEEAMKEVMNLQAQMKLGLVSSESRECLSNVTERKMASDEEIEELKEKLSKAMLENEKAKESVKELEEELEAMENSLATRLSVEECEEIKNTYSSLIENINQEKALLIDKYKEGQEEIKRLQEIQGTQIQPESKEDFKMEKATMIRTIDELRIQVTELTQLYNQAKMELQERRSTQSKENLQREEHENIIQELNRSVAETEQRLLEVEAKYQRAEKEVAELQKKQETQDQNVVSLQDHTQTVTTMENSIREMEVQNNELKEQLIKKNSEIQMLKDHFLEEKAAAVESMVPKSLYQQLKSSLEAELNLMRTKLKESVKEQEKTSLEVSKARKEIQQVKTEKENIQTLVESKDKEVNELHTKCQQVQESLIELQRNTDNASKLEEDKDKKISDLTKEVSKLKEALNSLSQLSYTTSAPKRQNQQLEALQLQLKQLQHQLAESKKQHQEIVSVYRMHLLYAVQGQMDEDVQKVLKQILSMCKSQAQMK